MTGAPAHRLPDECPHRAAHSKPSRRASSRAPSGRRRGESLRLAPCPAPEPCARCSRPPSFRNDAASPLPTDLGYLAVLNQHRHGELASSSIAQPREGVRICFDIVLLEVPFVALQPFAHFLRKRATRASVELSFGHDG